MLSVQFRGDFGIMNDELFTWDMLNRKPYESSISNDDIFSRLETGRYNNNNTNGNTTNSNNTNSWKGNNNNNPYSNTKFNNNNGMNSSGKFTNGLLDVPISDLSLLLSSPISGYGTRLHNLKIGRQSGKDV